MARVPPKLMAPQRRAGRARGKSDSIDALAVARGALREPRLDHPAAGGKGACASSSCWSITATT
jgi:transposase